MKLYWSDIRFPTIYLVYLLHCRIFINRSSLITTCNVQRIALQFKADLENLTNVKPEGEDFRWYLKVNLSFVVLV